MAFKGARSVENFSYLDLPNFNVFFADNRVERCRGRFSPQAGCAPFEVRCVPIPTLHEKGLRAFGQVGIRSPQIESHLHVNLLGFHRHADATVLRVLVGLGSCLLPSEEANPHCSP